MPTGLRVPVGVGPGGGAALVNSDPNDVKIIRLALSNDDNENPFQQLIGLGEGMVFGLNDPGGRGPVIRRIKEVFRRFEAQRRYRLIDDSITWQRNSDTQETLAFFRYLNLESDRVEDFSTGFDAAARTVAPTE